MTEMKAVVLIGVLQRKRTNRICVCVCVCVYKTLSKLIHKTNNHRDMAYRQLMILNSIARKDVIWTLAET